jgi:polyisoprenoid-binding protein YceI
MSKKLFLISIFIILFGSSFKGPYSVYTVSKGYIIFRSEAPLEIITARSNELRGGIETDTKQFLFSVRMKSFNGFNSALQKDHFNENYLESTKYPESIFKGKIIEDVDFTKDGVHQVRAKGNLTIHGITQERIIKGDLIIRNGQISIQSKFSVLLADHNIPIPKVVHEKLASDINVEVNTELRRK